MLTVKELNNLIIPLEEQTLKTIISRLYHSVWLHSYRKTTLTGTTMEHRLELGRFHVRNLLPNSIYKVRFEDLSR